MNGPAGRALRIARNAVLTVGAALGVVVAAAVLAGAAFGVRPVVVTSGSMEPAIDTGDLVLARTVPAADLAVGDVVTVPTSTGTRVTHRVAAVADSGEGRAVLTLRGDANPAPDAEAYPVSSADRMLLRVPRVGYVLSALRTTVGLVVLGALVMALLLFAFSGGGERGDGTGPSGGPQGNGRHRARRTSRPAASAGAGGVTTMAAAALLVVPSTAAWTDPVDVSGTAISAHTVVRPESASCTSLGLAATVTWPGDARYDYEVVLRRVSNGSVVSTTQVTGSSTSITYSGLGSFGLVVGAGTIDFQVEIRSYLATTTAWRSADVRTYSFIRVVAILIGATASCTT